jgi:uncharacterized membrane protein YhaH (DUF805 family)
MQKNDVILQKNRDFSDVFGDMFLFLKQNWRRLFYMLLVFAGPFVLIDGIVSAYTNSFIYNEAMNLGSYGQHLSFTDVEDTIARFLLWYLVMIIVKITAYAFLTTITYGYISLYAVRGKNFELQDLRPFAMSYFFPVIGASIVMGIIVGIGIVFCIIPGIYLGICLSFLIPVMMFEKRGFGYAFNRTFQLAHKDFWITLLILLIVAVGVAIVGMIFSIPMAGSNMMMVFTKALHQETSQTFSVVNLILTTISTVLISFLTVIPMIAISMQYFSISEKMKQGQGVPQANG